MDRDRQREAARARLARQSPASPPWSPLSVVLVFVGSAYFLYAAVKTWDWGWRSLALTGGAALLGLIWYDIVRPRGR